MTAQHKTDIVIIGAGPVGVFAIFEAGMLKMQCHVIDTLDFIGGQCTALYPEKPIYDIPAHPSITAEDLITQLELQAKPFDPTYHLDQQVVALDKQEDESFIVTTTNNTTIACNAVIIAAGCGAFGPNRPPLEGIETYEASGGIRYMIGKREEYRGKKLVIAGGGDSAVDWVLALADIAESISVVHRRPKFRCAPESHRQMMELVDAGKVELVVPYQLAGLHGENNMLSHVEVSTLDGESKKLEADMLLPFFGLSMNLGPIADWGLNLDKNHIQVTSSSMVTNEAGIFAVGDIATYEGKLKLILQGFSEAAVACHQCYNIIYPDTPLHFEYSTTKGVS